MLAMEVEKKEVNWEEFGRRVKAKREERGITIEHLAEQCSLTKAFFQKIEQGKKVVNLLNLVAICRSLQVSPCFLLEEELSSELRQYNWSQLCLQKNALSVSSQKIVDAVLFSITENLVQNEKDVEQKWGQGFDLEALGERLKIARRECNRTSTEIAKFCGINSTLMRQMETGTRAANVEVFVRICNCIAASPSYLLGNEIKIEFVESGWKELRPVQCDMTPAEQKVVWDVLTLLISGLAEKEKLVDGKIESEHE